MDQSAPSPSRSLGGRFLYAILHSIRLAEGQQIERHPQNRRRNTNLREAEGNGAAGHLGWDPFRGEAAGKGRVSAGHSYRAALPGRDPTHEYRSSTLVMEFPDPWNFLPVSSAAHKGVQIMSSHRLSWRFGSVACGVLTFAVLAGTGGEARAANTVPVYNENAVLVPSAGTGGGKFGRSVAVSGNTIVVGAWLDGSQGENSGAAHVYVRGEEGWAFQAMLQADDGAAWNCFGYSVAISGDTAVIGTLYAESAYVFVREGGIWRQQAKLQADDGASRDLFGSSVAISGDTVMVGAPEDDDLGDVSGSAYVFVRSGSEWTQQAKLLASNGTAWNGLGASVAISGDTAVVGASYFREREDWKYYFGAAYVFVRSGTTWTEETELPGRGATLYPASVAVSGGTAVVGAIRDGDSGAVQVFVREGTGWVPQARLIAGDPTYGFGASVGIDGDTLIVGAPADTSIFLGSAYLFTRSGVTWAEQAKLVDTRRIDGALGTSVSLSAGLAVAGAPGTSGPADAQGAAYVFHLGQWANSPPTADAGADQELECTGAAGISVILDGSGSTDADSTPGTNDDIVRFEWWEDFGRPTAARLGEGKVLEAILSGGFHVLTLQVTDGYGARDTDEVLKTVIGPCGLTAEDTRLVTGGWGAVDMDQESILAGNVDDADPGDRSGAAYVFVGSGTSWTRQAKLLAEGGEPGDELGAALAISGNTAVVGAYGHGTAGAAYVFVRSGDTWTQQAELLPDEGEAVNEFGRWLAIDGDTIAVGATSYDNWTTPHPVHVFVRSGATWTLQAKLRPEGYTESFGNPVAISGNTVVVGAVPEVRVFVRNGETWTEQAALMVRDDFYWFSGGIDVSGDTVLVGAARDQERGYASGAAYVFERSEGVWGAPVKILASDAKEGDLFGEAVGISGDFLIAGAPGEQGFDTPGWAYVFERRDGSWVQRVKLMASDRERGDYFGSDVALSGRTAVVGAPNVGAIYVYDLGVLLNSPPVAEAGENRTEECGGPWGAATILDGSRSTDPDSTPGTNDDILAFEWFEDLGQPTETFLGRGEILEVTLPLGTHAVTLRTTDRGGATATDQVLRVVSDSVSPVLSVAVAPGLIWPPNHRMVDMGASVVASDVCTTPTVLLASVTSSEPDDAPGEGDGNTTGDIQGAQVGTSNFDFQLRAERNGGGQGRAYLITYTAVDSSGNQSRASSIVFVPHDQGGGTEPLLISADADATGTVLTWPLVPGASTYQAIRGNVGSLSDAGAFIDLGTVSCIQPATGATNTLGKEDAEDPPLGEAYFYLVAYNDGRDSGYGSDTATKPRVKTGGGCE